MNSIKKDIVFAIICGLAIAWVANDFFKEHLWLFVVLPILSIIGLWLVNLIGRKLLFVKQAGKFVLSGAFADVVDIKVFQFLFLFAPFSLFFKGISFLLATAIKYWANKYWSFEKYEKENVGREVVIFFLITLVGLAIDVVSFYYFSIIKTVVPIKLWVELSIIFAALVAAVWNFLGYKFLVFKR